MDWIKVKVNHIIHEYDDLTDKEFRAWMKIMAVTAFLEHDPTQKQILKECHHKTLKSLQEKLKDHSTDLQDIAKKVLRDVQDVSKQRDMSKLRKRRQRELEDTKEIDDSSLDNEDVTRDVTESVQGDVTMDVPGDVTLQRREEDRTMKEEILSSSSFSVSKSPKKQQRRLLSMLETCRNGNTDWESLSSFLDYLEDIQSKIGEIEPDKQLSFYKENKKMLNDMALINAEEARDKKKNTQKPVVDVKDYATGIKRNVLNRESDPEELVESLEAYIGKLKDKRVTVWRDYQTQIIRDENQHFSPRDIDEKVHEKMAECPYL